MTRNLRFPDGFVWGTATSSYQIEGAASEGGRGPSIWDTFARTEGAIIDGTTGDVACDHYHRYEADFDLMRDLGFRGYRLSVAWPRIFPTGAGKPNPAGLDFYARLLDALGKRGIEPYVTLYHWDLPQPLQDAGGWTSRDTASRFAEYAAVVARALGDRVRFWMTHNEPWVAALVGNLFGSHAPGGRDLRTALQVAHGILLSHGWAVPAIRAEGGGRARVGIVHNLEWVEPATPKAEDLEAAARHDGGINRWFLDPVFRGCYPEDMWRWYGASCPVVEPGDLESIAAPTDFLGVNYYTRRIVAHDPQAGFLQARKVQWPFAPRADYEEWEISPEGLYRVLMRVDRDYGHPPIYVTESGTALDDRPGPDGLCADEARIHYLRGHAAAIWQAIQDGVDARGYFVWSFLDNFEWNLGLTKRFGLVHVDFATQTRTPKASARWYAAVSRDMGFPV